MRSIRFLSIALCAFGLVAFSACNNDVEVKEDGTTTVDTTTAGSAVNSAGQEVKTESVETMVETALLAKPGFGEVDVESQGDGVIVLNGTVATENEKAQAQVTAENTTGVKQVINNLTIKQ